MSKKRMNLVFEQWEEGEELKGTIRTEPEGYYVCDVCLDGKLHFEELEVMTRHYNKKKVQKWWDKN